MVHGDRNPKLSHKQYKGTTLSHQNPTQFQIECGVTFPPEILSPEKKPFSSTYTNGFEVTP